MIKLIAEICNKISKDGRNFSDRLEKQLTGDFLGHYGICHLIQDAWLIDLG